MFICQRPQLFQLGRVPPQMDRNDRFSLRRDQRLDRSGADMVGVGLKVGEDRHRLLEQNPNHGADVREG